MYRLKSPLSAQIEITETCNNACLHCYNYWRYLKDGQRISFNKCELRLKHFQKILGVLLANEVKNITFTGGEPFLRRDILFDLIKKAKKAGANVGINTNGSLITRLDIRHLKEMDVDFLLVSLLGGDFEAHNRITNAQTFILTCNAIKILVENELDTTVNMVVSIFNWNNVRKTALCAKNLGVKVFSATPVLPCPFARDHLDISLRPEQIKSVLDDLLWIEARGMKIDVLEPLVHCMFNTEERNKYLQFLDHRSCSAGISDMVVSVNGDIRPCILAPQTYGNLILQSWEECWNNLACWASSDLLPVECLDCAAVDDCGGGCRIAALSKSGSIKGKDPYMTKRLTEISISRVNRVLEKEITSDTNFKFPSDVFLRKEKFGSVLFRGKKFIFLDKDGTELVVYLKSCNFFTFQSVREEIEINENDFSSFLNILLSGGFLVASTKKGGLQ